MRDCNSSHKETLVQALEKSSLKKKNRPQEASLASWKPWKNQFGEEKSASGGWFGKVQALEKQFEEEKTASGGRFGKGQALDKNSLKNKNRPQEASSAR